MNDYPTRKILKQIKEWPASDLPGLMAFIKPLWNYSDCGYWSQEGECYKISTAGWSGNESIIAAMQENHLFWLLNWQQSTRGGHYIFVPLGQSTPVSQK